jgi:hypothetical protein
MTDIEMRWYYTRLRWAKQNQVRWSQAIKGMLFARRACTAMFVRRGVAMGAHTL